MLNLSTTLHFDLCFHIRVMPYTTTTTTYIEYGLTLLASKQAMLGLAMQ